MSSSTSDLTDPASHPLSLTVHPLLPLRTDWTMRHHQETLLNFLFTAAFSFFWAHTEALENTYVQKKVNDFPHYSFSSLSFHLSIILSLFLSPPLFFSPSFCLLVSVNVKICTEKRGVWFIHLSARLLVPPLLSLFSFLSVSLSL